MLHQQLLNAIFLDIDDTFFREKIDKILIFFNTTNVKYEIRSLTDNTIRLNLLFARGFRRN